MPDTATFLSATKYAGAKFEYGHPYNDAAYNLVYDAPAIVDRMRRYEAILNEMEEALELAREQLGPLISDGKVDGDQLEQVNASLAHLRELRADHFD